MYAGDNNDYCAGNNYGDTGGEKDWCAYKGKFTKSASMTPCTNWISGWMDVSGTAPNNDITVSYMTGESDNTNQDLLVDPNYSSMGDYTKNPQLFICPACVVRVDSYTGGPKNVSEIRSVSMNCRVGFVCSPADTTANFKTFNKTTAITAGMSPVDLFVFMEERGESIDDGLFDYYVEPNSTLSQLNYFNWPTDYHNLAATVGFADGHVEAHRWTGCGTLTDNNGNPVGTTLPQVQVFAKKWTDTTSGLSGSQLTDAIWLQTHGTCPSN